MNPSIYTTDTSLDAERFQLDAFREMSPQERIRKMCSLSTTLRRMAFATIRRNHPDINDQEVRLRFIEAAYGRDLAQAVRTHVQSGSHG